MSSFSDAYDANYRAAQISGRAAQISGRAAQISVYYF